jgi:hypothetical protein
MTALLRLNAVFFLVLSVFLSPISARPQFSKVDVIQKREVSDEYITNAARMAAGLGPLMPRHFYNPTRVNVARTSNPSAIPTCGRIKVTQCSNGDVLGFVNKNYNPKGRFNLKDNVNAKGDHLTVCFARPASTSSLFDMFITSNGNPKHPNVGFAHGSPTLASSNDYVTLTGTYPTTPGGGAAEVGNGMSDSNSFSESPIWSYDASTGALTSTWINPGPSNVALKYYVNLDTLALVGSTSAPRDFVEVNFTLV